MGTVVIGGLFVATILTLLITPVFYVGVERMRDMFGRTAHEKAPSRGEHGGIRQPTA